MIKYTKKTKVIQYEPNLECEIKDPRECYDLTKYNELLTKIWDSDLPFEDKEFLEVCATRFIDFNYSKIADFYAQTKNKELQDLMEQLCLVILDYDDALEKGYVQIKKEIEKMKDE